jgi:hypothetical protein
MWIERKQEKRSFSTTRKPKIGMRKIVQTEPDSKMRLRVAQISAKKKDKPLFQDNYEMEEKNLRFFSSIS